MTRRFGRKSKQKKKIKAKKKSAINKAISETQFNPENLIRLKVTVRKGARIESVPLKKLEELSKRSKRFWKLKDEWLILYALS